VTYHLAVRIRVLAFASAADALGASEQELEVPAGTTLAQLRAQLVERHPALAPIAPRLAWAVNGEIGGGAALREGDEVALLPPVSGGAPTAAERVAPGRLAALCDEPIDAAAVVAGVAGPGCGAVLLFLGTVRDRHQGRPVRALTYAAYRSMAERRLARIVEELEAASPGLRVAIVHRLGRLAPGEASVAIAVASPHRELAYAASREALERLKAEVPIWKREHYADGGERWREDEPLGDAGARA
jgi:molybdopterin synthase catalytic subunit